MPGKHKDWYVAKGHARTTPGHTPLGVPSEGALPLIEHPFFVPGLAEWAEQP
jgi:hypothetical protein